MTATTPTVGVVIPTYERAHETVRAVESVMAQTLLPTQVVVVDDGSSHATIEELAGLLAPHPVDLIRAPRSTHPGRARNAGLDVLRTRWVAFLDSDDTWAPGKLEAQLSAVGQAAAICTNARRIVRGVPDGTVLGSLPTVIRLRDLINVNVVINSSVLIRRAVLDEVGGVASSYLVRGCEDYATWLRVASRHSWVGLDEPLVDYVDEPAVSVRGSEEFSVHPGRQAAWLDYVIWRRETGAPIVLAEKILSTGLRRALILQRRVPRSR